MDVIQAAPVMPALEPASDETAWPVMQFLVMPMFFLSGAIFPPSGPPEGLAVLTKLDPLSYAVDPMRRAVFAHVHASLAVQARLNAGVSWSGWRLPVPLELTLVASGAVVALLPAIWQFSRTE